MYSTVGGYLQMYVFASLESGRNQLQILHECDSYCFRAVGLGPGILAYNVYAQPQVGGWMQTGVTAGNLHEMRLRDKVLIAYVVERFRKRGNVAKSDFQRLPFDDSYAQRARAPGIDAVVVWDNRMLNLS